MTQNYKHILAIDTATGPTSTALCRHGELVALLENPQVSAQSAQLIPMIEQALAQAGLTYKELSAIACTVGPGSFTGLRVGLSAARAIGLATGLPVLGYTTLEVLGFAAREYHKGHALALLAAGKGEHYFQLFSLDGLRAQTDARLGRLPETLPPLPDGTATIGNAMLDGSPFLPPVSPRADALALLACSGLLAPRPPEAFYIRPPDAKLMAQKA